MEKAEAKAGGAREKEALSLIASCVRRNLDYPHYRILAYGSRARKTAVSRSDFDIAVEAGGKIPLAVLARIEADLEDLPILQKVDLVDLAAADPGFRSEVLKDAKVLYER